MFVSRDYVSEDNEHVIAAREAVNGAAKRKRPSIWLASA